MSDKFATAKQANLGHLLFRCARLFNERAIQQVQAAGEARIRTAHTSLFPHIDLEGTRLVDLVERVGISKQAVGQLVQELEEMGTLVRERDPHDGRAWLVRFSQRGREQLLLGLSLLSRMEAELAVAIGGERSQRLVEDLGVLLEALEGGAPPNAPRLWPENQTGRQSGRPLPQKTS